MDEPNETVMSRIKKLLALSRNNSSEEEAASAAAKAQELLIRFNLSEDALGNSDTPKERFTSERYTAHRSGQQEPQWKVLLAFAVGKSNLCRVLHIGGVGALEWFGKPSNIEVGKYLFETLCYDIEQIAIARWKQIVAMRTLHDQYPEFDVFTDSELYYIHGKKWKDSFYRGAVNTITHRLNEGLTTLKKEDSVNALITTNNSDLANYVKEIYPKLGKFNGGHASTLSGYSSGQQAGRTIQFKRGVNGAGGSMGPRLIGGK